MSKLQSAIGLVVCFAAAFSAAAIGSIASIRAADLYAQLSRPAWAPPGSVFGPVWTFLFCCMALASWLIWRERQARRSTALTLYAIQLVLNALWSWLFFAWRSGRWAFIEVLVLWTGILLTMVFFWRIRKVAALLLVPYLLWVTFASCLTFAVWQLNPQLFS